MDLECSDFHGQKGDDVDFTVVISSDHSGLRLDHFLAGRLSQYSRSQLTSSIKKGLIKVNDMAAKASRKLQLNDVVSGCVELPRPMDVIPQKIDFEILFEDQYLLAVSKPPGLVVHPADGNPDNTLVNGLVYHCRNIQDVGDPARPGIVHRLDKDTSGAMIVAKNESVHRQLVEVFKSRQVKKNYFAIVVGGMTAESGRVVAPIGRHPVNRKKMSVREGKGKYAVSNWTLERTIASGYSLLNVEIETGRTHQIRVHMAHIGNPVAGDTLYGAKNKNVLFQRQMLHSSRLQLIHPVSGHKLKIEAPLWPDMVEALQVLENGAVS